MKLILLSHCLRRKREKDFMTVFSTILRQKIDDLCVRFDETSPLFAMGRRNELHPFHAAAYVVNLEHLFRENEQDILTASQTHTDDPRLSEFFLEKWREERGHNAWAKNDWVEMSKATTFDIEPEVIGAMRELTD